MSAPAEAQPDHDDDSVVPQFVLTALDDGEDVSLLVSTPTRPDFKRHASMALLYGLAVMTLDQDGAIERRIEELLARGAINEVDAVNHINLLLLKEDNDLSI